MTMHTQVEIDGIKVDEEMAPLLQLLWARGWKTAFSCQGNPERGRCYISFETVPDAVAFLVHLRDTLGFDDFYVHAGRYSMILSMEGRAVVYWDRCANGPGTTDLLAKTIEVCS